MTIDDRSVIITIDTSGAGVCSMAKKSHTGHRPMPQQAKGAARKPQTPGGAASSATLVRAPDAPPANPPQTPSASNVVADTPAATPAPRPAAAPAAGASAKPSAAAVAAKPAAPKSAAAKPAAPKPAAPAARPQANTSTREQNQRLARARATQRARQANLISASNYSYVLGDLKLVVALAISAFVILIALTFVLPH
jgi:hypothetical protein